MNERLTRGILAGLSGILMAVALLWLGAAATVQANGTTRYVATTGSDASNDCSNSGNPCATIQHAIDQSSAIDVDQIRVAGGTFTRVGTVAEITKSLIIIGGHAPDFSGHDPDMYHTVLDAQWGGSVISVTSAGEVVLDFLTITRVDGTGNCSSRSYGGCGGGIYAQETALYVGHSVITNNVGTTVDQAAGGGIYLFNRNGNAPAELWENYIVSNTASTDDTAWGGGLYIEAGNAMAPAIVVTNTFQTNKASTASSGLGGGVFLLSYATLRNNLFDGNVASVGGTDGYGGGLYMWEVRSATLEANRFLNNQAVGTILEHGGAIYAGSHSIFTMTNSLLAGNHAGTEGDGLYLESRESSRPLSITLINNTLADNDTGGGSEGIRVSRYLTLTLKNNIIAGHSIGITNTNPASNTISADYNLFWNTSDPITGTNAIVQDPLFMPGYGYHLHRGSPAINAGLTIPWLTIDLDGRPRPPRTAFTT